MATTSIFDLTDRVALVTGGYSHLGSAMTAGLLAFNSRVIVVGRSWEKFKAAFPQPLAGLSFVEANVSDSTSVERLMDHIAREHGRIDILINNASQTFGCGVVDVSDTDWAATLDAVLGAAYRVTRVAFDLLKKSNMPRIINVASMYGIVSPDPALYADLDVHANPPHYGAGKAALIQLTKYFAVAFARHGIRVNAIAPGPFPTPSVQAAHPTFVKRLGKRTVVGRIGIPDDLVGVTVLLASAASEYITGQCISVDGGWTTT